MKKSSKRLQKKVEPIAIETPVLHVRRPSHIPLFDEEKDKLFAAAKIVGLPYATWARATLLVVAGWPADLQPIRVGTIQATPRSFVAPTRQAVSGEVGSNSVSKEIES
jgi:hypothetical protein